MRRLILFLMIFLPMATIQPQEPPNLRQRNLERRIFNLEHLSKMTFVQEYQPTINNGWFWFKPSAQELWYCSGWKWILIQRGDEQIDATRIGDGSVDNEEFSLFGYEISQLKGRLTYNPAPLGSWNSWIKRQTVNGFWFLTQHWTDSSWWYYSPDTIDMWLSDTIFAGEDTTLYDDFQSMVRTSTANFVVYETDFSSTDTVDITHNLGTRQIALQVWLNDSTECWPNNAHWVDDNSAQVSFLSDQSGKVLVMRLQ